MWKLILLGSTQNKTRTLRLTASCIFPATVGPMRNASVAFLMICMLQAKITKFVAEELHGSKTETRQMLSSDKMMKF